MNDDDNWLLNRAKSLYRSGSADELGVTIEPMKVVAFPDISVGDVPRMVRAIADSIEEGKYGDAHNLAWVIDCGNGRIEIGLCGASPEAGATAYLLLGLAKRKIEDECIGGG